MRKKVLRKVSGYCVNIYSTYYMVVNNAMVKRKKNQEPKQTLTHMYLFAGYVQRVASKNNNQ